jgi:hypothetical protein
MRKALSDVAGAWRLERPGDLAVGEQQNAVGVCRRHRIVGDHDHCVPVLVDDLAEQGEHLVPGVSVQRSCRLVGEHHLRPGDECPGDRDPLLLAAGELRGAVAQALVQPDPGGDLTDGRAPRPVAVQPQRQRDVLGDGERWQQVEGLEHEPDPLTPQDRQPLFAEVRQGGAAERHGSGGGPVQPGRHVQECALARARWSHDRGERSRRQCGADAVEGDDRAFAPTIDLADITQHDRRRRGGSPGFHAGGVGHETNVRPGRLTPHRREAGVRLLLR